MEKTLKNNRIKNIIVSALIALFGVAIALLEWLPITFSKDAFYNGLIAKTLQQLCGVVAAVLLLNVLRIKAFGRIQNYLYLLPCLLVAVNNFQWWSYLNGLQSLVRTNVWDILFFAFYCLCVGLFEECIFRGVLFSLVASYLPQNKKGLFWTFVISSVIFGLAHLFGGNPLQALYTVLTGGLFAFVLIKTKNLLCCALVHGVYNFCGLLMETESSLGLGTGVVLMEWGNVVIMGVVGVLMAAFVFYSLWKYPEEERIELYKRLVIPTKTPQSIENTAVEGNIPTNDEEEMNKWENHP